jgi:sortase A
MARGDVMRFKNLVLILAALATVFVLAACGSSGQSSGDQGSQGGQEQQQQDTPNKQVAPDKGAQDSGDQADAVTPPPNNMMRLTIPEMAQIKNDQIPTGLGTNETLFHDYAAVHIKNTGFPWEKVANVYIAGHRLGYQNTNSYLAFWDLNKLEKGDEFYITDSKGRKYTYVVIRKFIATPDNLSVLNPVPGKNIVTLQTCTLPDYTQRLLVRGELKDIQQT